MNALAIAAESLGQADRGGRADDVPSALHARDLRRRSAVSSRRNMFDPVRETPLHSWFVARGAIFEESGLWKRASRVPLPGESREATIRRECLATRAKAGIMDASTLGKIEVVGPDAAEFLNRLYVNSFTKLGVGRCRYGLMLNEMGFVYDDGVVMRLAEDRFHITTTTSGAAHVHAVMEDYLQTEWTDLKTALHLHYRAVRDDRDQRPGSAQTSSRRWSTGVDLSAAAFPHLSVREGFVCGVPVAARARQLHR